MKKSYSPKEIRRLSTQLLDWDEEWSSVFGNPALNENWFICGSSGSGKSSFVMQLSKVLCRFGRVLYVSYEEGIRPSFRRRISYLRMDEVQGLFRVVTSETYDDLRARLSKPKSARFVVIDSVQMSGMDYPHLESLTREFSRKSFIWVSQERRGQPLGSTALRLRYLAGVKVWVRGYKAWSQSRESCSPGAYYTVWEEGVARIELNV